MSKAMKDPLIAEIVGVCAGLYSENSSVGRFNSEHAPYSVLLSPCRVGNASLSNRCIIAPQTMIGGSFIPNDATKRFYMDRATAALLTTGPLPSDTSIEPLSMYRWIPLNERLHAKGAKILLQICLNGASPRHVATLAASAAAAAFDGVYLDMRCHDEEVTEIVQTIRSRLGASFLILARSSLSPAVYESGLEPSGNVPVRSLAEVLELLATLARAGVNAFEIGLGGADTPWLLQPASQMPAACFAEAARAVKAHFRYLGIQAAVIASGKLSSPKLAEDLLQKGCCDMVSLDGAGISDPAWFDKLCSGKIEEICPHPLPDFIVPNGHETIAVVGAGYRGLCYAIQAADAGHLVDLFEAREQLGGALAQFASRSSYEKKILLAYLLREVEKREEIRLHKATRADRELLKKGHYDRIVFACSASAITAPNIPGWGGIPFVTADCAGSALCGSWKRKHVAVIGSDALACDLALALQSEGMARKVTVITERPEIMLDEPNVDRAWFRHHFAQRGGLILEGYRMLRMRKHTVFAENAATGKETHIRCDAILLAEKAPTPLRLYEDAVRERLAQQIQLL